MTWWDSSSLDEAWYKIVGGPENIRQTKEVVEVILKGIRYGHAALEIGCGVGRLMRQIAERFHIVEGVDISQTMVDFSRQELLDFPQCQVFKNDGKTLPFVSRRFDFVYSNIAFQHMHTLEIIRENIQEIHRVLEPGGMARIQTVKGTPYQSHDGNDGYLFEDPNEFLRLFTETGFNAVAEVGITHYQHIWVTGIKP